MKEKLLDKLVSHRLRGYDRCENSLAGLEAAMTAAVPPPAIEIDTRLTVDGRIVVHHDPSFRDSSGRKIDIARTSWTDIIASSGDSPVPDLDSFLALFRQSGIDRILIDIKDFGMEQAHVELVRKHDLVDRTVFVSWVPQVLRELDGFTRFLSHRNVARFRSLGRLVSSGRRMHRLPWGLLMTGDPLPLPDRYRRGYHHALLCSTIPAALLSAVDGVCIDLNSATGHTVSCLREQGLSVAVYSTRGSKKYTEFATRQDIDLVFSDDAPVVIPEICRG